MFSKRPPSTPAPAAAPRGVAVKQLLANPVVGAGGTAALFFLLLGGVIAVTGNPQAGSPSVKIALSQVLAGHGMPEGWREALAPEPEHAAELSGETVVFSTSAEAAHETLGPTTVTLPAGGHVVTAQALTPAPVLALTAPGPGGSLLPAIAPDGRIPATTYSRPFVADGRPRIGLVIGGLGLDANATAKAITSLPPDVTLSFASTADRLQYWIDQARAAGHEVLLEVPMQPANFPDSDAGQNALAPGDSASDLTTKLEWTLSRATGYFGVVNYQGSGFLAASGPVATLAANLKKRGLAFVDDGQPAARAAQLTGVLRGSSQSVIDDELSANGIQARMSALETAAQKNGSALATGFAYPLTIDQAVTWSSQLSSRGFQLAPASALIKR
jgi:polysaccharide deacetylase 2 family uncharacterized protein YibQ